MDSDSNEPFDAMESDKENDCFEPNVTTPPGGYLKQRLDAIFAEVTNNLPSIDFEFSDVSSEEGEVTVFQPHVRSVTVTSDTQVDVSLNDVSVDIEDDMEYSDRLDNILDQIQTGTMPSDTSITKEEHKASVSETEKETDTLAYRLFGEECDVVERNYVSRQHGHSRSSGMLIRRAQIQQREENAKAIASRFMPSQPPTLMMKNIDIDLLLNTVGESDLSCLSSECSVLEPRHIEKATSVIDEQGDGLSLIEKLAQISLSESERRLHNIDPNTGAIQRKTKSGTELKKHKTAQNLSKAQKKVSCMGTNTRDVPNLPTGIVHTPSKPPEERETIYIDLRGFENKKATKPEGFDSVQRILQITSEATSDSEGSDEDNEAEMWHEQRKRIKESLQKTGSMPPEFHRSPVTKPCKVSKPVTTQLPHPRVSDRVKLKAPSTMEDDQAEAEEQKREREERRRAGCARAVRENTHKELTKEEEERMRRREEARRLQEVREREHQSRLRLGRQLEAMHPSTTSNGRKATIEATPTLFDTEVSYEPAPESLPPHLPADWETALLTIDLSSNSEVTGHKLGGANARSIDNRASLSGTYTALLTWLLSLVPDNFSFPREASVPTSVNGRHTPFEVIGLQQMFLDDQLCLFVAVAPTVNTAQVSAKMKKSKMKDDLTVFQKVLTKFLLTNTLSSVCPWLEELISLDISPDQRSTEQSTFAYKLPLPNITNRPLSTFVQVNNGTGVTTRVLNLPVGFFWQLLDNDDASFIEFTDNDTVSYDTQTTMSLVYKRVYREPRAMMGILNRVLQEGLDLAGIRLLYPRPEVIDMRPGDGTRDDVLSNIGPILAVAVRGTFARTVWLDAIGPSDPALARITDPTSLCALFGGQSREECLLFCPRSPMRVMAELCRWFGGRVPASGVVITGGGRKKEMSRQSKKDTRMTSDLPGHLPPATLTATLPTDLFLLLSPLVPARCIGLLLATAQHRGYQLRGFRQLKLGARKCSLLGLCDDQPGLFCGSTCGVTPDSENEDHDGLVHGGVNRPCMVMQLRKENALHHVGSLIEALVAQLALINMLATIQENCNKPLKSSHLFHPVSFSETVLNALGGDLAQVPNVDVGSTPGFIAPKLYTNPELEEFVVLTFTGLERLKKFGQLLSCLQNVMPYSKNLSSTSVCEGFEMLGLKWLPSLNSQQARQLTPFEVGDKDWKSSVHTLTSMPAVLLLLRGVDAFRRIRSFIAGLRVGHPHRVGKHDIPLDCLMSPTPDIAYQQAVIFFHRRELYPDPSVRWLLPYLPPHQATAHSGGQVTSGQVTSGQVTSGPMEESVFESMLRGPQPLCTFLLMKPGAVMQGLSKLLKKLCHEGFVVVAMRLETLTHSLAVGLVQQDDTQDEESCRSCVSHTMSGPCLLLSVQRENAVKKLMDLLGPEDPKVARMKNCGYWRGIFGQNCVANGLYASGSYARAVQEQKLFFPDGLCCRETLNLKLDSITCQAVDSIASKVHSQKRHLVTITDHQGQLQSDNINSSSNITSQGSSICIGPRVTPSTLGCLTQTTCVFLTPTLLQPPLGRGRHAPYVDIMEALLKNRFQLVGCRMLWFTKEQAEQCLHLYQAGSFSLVPQLTSGPSIVLALQRDNAIVLFDTLLGSVYDKESLYFKYNSCIMRSKDTKQAIQQLCFFFDKLTLSAHTQIVVDE